MASNYDYTMQSTSAPPTKHALEGFQFRRHPPYRAAYARYALLNTPIQSFRAQTTTVDYTRCFREFLEHVGDVHGHLVNLRGVVLLDVSEDTNVVRLDEVDRYTLAPESS